MISNRLGKRYERDMGYYTSGDEESSEDHIVYRRAKSLGDLEFED